MNDKHKEKLIILQFFIYSIKFLCIEPKILLQAFAIISEPNIIKINNVNIILNIMIWSEYSIWENKLFCAIIINIQWKR